MARKKQLVTRHFELDVYKAAFNASMEIFRIARSFPKDERYSLTDQIRRSSRSVCANIAEAWRKRRYEASFVSKLNDSEAEAAETQTWIQYAVECEYVDQKTGRELFQQYEKIIGKFVRMIANSGEWVLKKV